MDILCNNIMLVLQELGSTSVYSDVDNGTREKDVKMNNDDEVCNKNYIWRKKIENNIQH